MQFSQADLTLKPTARNAAPANELLRMNPSAYYTGSHFHAVAFFYDLLAFLLRVC